MANVVRNVGELDSTDRQALEHVLGQPLEEHQQLVIRIVTPNVAPVRSETAGVNGDPVLPEWCNVYAGLSDEEIQDLEKTILTRADLTRSSE